MYYYLKGRIVKIENDFAVIDVNNVGYEFLTINENDFKLDEECLVYTLHIVREDEELFVGFKDLKSKEIFTKLINVKGIGPKTAVGALRGTTIDQFISLIRNNDIKGLKKLPGIGPKAAAQIILDMNGSLKASDIENVKGAETLTLNKEQEYAKGVLKDLGFKISEINEVLKKIPEVLPASDIVNEALKRLSK